MAEVDNKQLIITIPANDTNETIDNENSAAPVTPAKPGIPVTPGTMEATKKKRGGGFQIFQATMFLLRLRPSKKNLKAPVSMERVASNNAWKRFLASMRPLHLQDDDPSSPESRTPVLEIAAAPSTPTGSEAGYEDVHPPPMSRSASEDGMHSRYASAVNLQELDRSEQDVEDKSKGKGGADVHEDEDEHIDAKAEEFIAQFYRQMKLQPLD